MAQPLLAIIVAHTRNRVIGRNNGMPWHLPADLRFFRELTSGHPILMGRKTHAAIGRPLPGRRNLVLTRQHALQLDGAECVGSLDEAIQLCQDAAVIFVIGGAEIYRQLLPQMDRLHITEIQAELEGDAWFPELPEGHWREVHRSERPADEKNPYALSFVTLERARR